MDNFEDAKPIEVTMAKEWEDAFRAQAAAEGLTLSQWIALACRKALPTADASPAGAPKPS